MNAPVVVALAARSLPLARRLAELAGGEVHGFAHRVVGEDVVPFEHVGEHLATVFSERRPIVAVMASGALLRCLAPVLGDKRDEPLVLTISEDGSSVVPLLGGHHGANDLARRLAEALGAHAAVTTASDTALGVALDEPPTGYELAAGEHKAVVAAMLAGEAVRIEGDLPWLEGLKQAPDARVTLRLSDEIEPVAEALELVFRPRRFALGLGCERGVPGETLLAHARALLADAGIAAGSLACVASLDLKADEVAIHEVAAALGAPVRFFDAATLEREVPRLRNPSKVVFAEVGCHGVAEGAALASVGPDGALVVPKRAGERVTAALAAAPCPFEPRGRARGHLSIVGLGPGAEEWRSPQASRAVRDATDLVGYSLYLDLCGPLANGKVRHDFPLGAEEDRVRAAMELAGEGRSVALVCSGDPGIYAMASLAFELLDRGGVSDAAGRISIEVCPGISALQAAAARIGAPLGHDFCAISLSDLLTPWEAIERRIEAAARGDFVIAFYNPVSRRRRTQLAHAKSVLLDHRPADTPVVLATNLGREGESVRVVRLDALEIDEVDMLTTVVVGSSHTRAVGTGDGRTWVYTPRGYDAKEGTRMGAPNVTGEAAE